MRSVIFSASAFPLSVRRGLRGKLDRAYIGTPTIARVMAGELQPLGVERLFAWVLALVVVHRCFHVVSDAKDATNCRAGSTLDAFSFLSATKLPFALARYFQIREFIFDASAHSHHLPIRLARGMRGRAIRNFFPLFHWR